MKNIFFVVIYFLNCTVYAQHWDWAKSGNGTGTSNNKGSSVCVAVSGNVFVTGFFTSSTITFGSTTLTNTGSADIFIVKYDANGNVLWAKSIGGSIGGGEGGSSVSADANDNVFLTGNFYSPTITFGSTTLTNAGYYDMFIAKYDTNGNALWAKSAGGINGDYGSSVSADANGNVFVTGGFSSPTISFGTTTFTKSGVSKVFVVKYDANGNVLWAKSAEGWASFDAPYSVSADAGGNVLVTGAFESSVITFDSITLINGGGGNSFIAKFDSTGNILWAKSSHGTGSDEINSVCSDENGNAFVTGWFDSPTLTFGSTTLINSGIYNIFTAKYDVYGNILWARSAGGSGDDEGCSVSSDGTNVFVSGKFLSSSLTFGSFILTPPIGSSDPMFLVKYDANGNPLCASALASGGGNNNSVSADLLGNAYVGSDFAINSFIVGIDTLQLTSLRNVFVAKYFCDGNLPTAINELINKESVFVHPNPSSGIFEFNLKNKTDGTKICVYDMLGKSVYDKVSMKNNNKEIDLSSQPKGVYFMEILSPNERIIKKIVLQ